MEHLKGYVGHIIHFNESNGYTVLELNTDTGEEITCVGILHAIDEGECVEFGGEFVNHRLYGEQFSIREYAVIKATDELSILRYLSSGAIKGIGKSLAQRIVDRFGADTLDVMENDPESLAQVKGISLRKAEEISSVYIEKRDLRRVMMFLQKYGISNNLAMKIYARYGDEIYAIMEENPYRLAEDIDGIGFKTADEIASVSGIAVDSAYRVRSGILYILSGGVGEGHTYLPKDLMLQKAGSILGVEEEIIWTETENLSMDKRLVIKQKDDGIRIYSNIFYYMEMNCARMLSDLDIVLDTDEKSIRKLLGSDDFNDGIGLEELQTEAVVNAIKYGVSIITGGPGTGKTTTINSIIRCLEERGDDFILAAPTGRAAKRMTEATGYEAATIQRTLGLSMAGTDGRGYLYDRNEDNPLETDTIIIDEMSMVDLPLFNALLKAVMPGTRLILVGDTDQLPSVGPGSVLKDIIDSGCFKVASLKKIFRQDDKSEIILNAHRINEGIVPVIDNKGKDFFFLERSDVNVIMKAIVTLVSDKLPRYVGARSFDIQVLTPMRKGPLGVENLNPVLQKYLNPQAPDKREKSYGNTLFREGDKVMQIRNNYQLEWEVTGKYGIVLDKGLGVFNGDMGIIRRIDDAWSVMEVEYEDNHVIKYPYSNLDELELAYAVTIHKSQGSEYPAVVIPLLNGPKPLFNRNLLYTAVTRARQCVMLLGSKNTFASMIANADETKRYTSLNECLREIAGADFS